jgi:hypothetical protein
MTNDQMICCKYAPALMIGMKLLMTLDEYYAVFQNPSQENNHEQCSQPSSEEIDRRELRHP